MPYHIQKYKKGYRVVSDKGIALSKDPLSYEQAYKQLVAVSLKEGIFRVKKKKK